MQGLDLKWDFVPLPQKSAVGTSNLDFGGLLATPLQVEQDGGATGCGGKLWPAGELLSRYLIRQPSLPYRKIIELGSGTGLSGLAVAMGHPEARDTEIFITDQANMMPLMTSNIELNGQSQRVHAKVLDWGAPLPEYTRGADLIVAADCVYLESAFPLLRQTLLDLTEKEEVPILMAYKRRRKADRHFFKAMKKDFVISQISDFPEFEDFRRDSVFLFAMRRRKSSSL